MLAFLFITIFLPITNLVTHWVVSNGKVQPVIESPFNMRNAEDLVEFLNQENRVVEVEQLQSDLLLQKESLQEDTVEETERKENDFTRFDVDCLAAGKSLDLFIDEVSFYPKFNDFELRIDDFLSFQSSSVNHQPACDVIYSSSVHTIYDSLKGVQEKGKLKLIPESSITVAFSNSQDASVIGSRIYEALMKDNDSWLGHNLATLYWRIVGNGEKSMECALIALSLTPERYQCIPLFNLAAILLNGHFSSDSITVATKAIGVCPESHQKWIYYLLGNAYTAMQDFPTALAYYEKALYFNLDVDKRIHAIKCYVKNQKLLEDQQEVLEKTLQQLESFRETAAKFQEAQKLMQERQQEISKIVEDELVYQTIKLRNQESMVNDNFLRLAQSTSEQECRHDAHCDLTKGPLPPNVMDKVMKKMKAIIGDDEGIDFKILQSYVEHLHVPSPSLKGEDPEVVEHVLDRDYPSLLTSHSEAVAEPPAAPIVDREIVGDFQNYKLWAGDDSDLQCNDHSSLYRPFFKRLHMEAPTLGISISYLISTAIDIPENEEHSLPWYLPVCDISKHPYKISEKYNLMSMLGQVKKASITQNAELREKLIQMIQRSGVTVEEIGQRIRTAIEQNVEPIWIVYNAASLVWQVSGNYQNAMKCLVLAQKSVSENFLDVIYTNAAQLLLDVGKYQEALQLSNAAASLSLHPTIQYTLGSALAATGNISGAISSIQIATWMRRSADPELSNLLHTLRCRFKFYHPLKDQSPTVIASGCSTAYHKVGGNFFCKHINGIDHCVLERQEIMDTLCVEDEGTSDSEVLEIVQVFRSDLDTSQFESNLEKMRVREIVYHTLTDQFVSPSTQIMTILVDQSPLELHAVDGSSGENLNVVDVKDKDDGFAPKLEAANDQSIDLNDNRQHSEFSSQNIHRPNSLVKSSSEESSSHSIGKGNGNYPARYATGIRSSRTLQKEECENWGQTSVRFVSTWVHPDAIGISVHDHIDFSKFSKNEPICTNTFTRSPVDHLIAIQRKSSLIYYRESDLTSVLKLLSGLSLNSTRASLAHALTEKPSNWIAANVAALYWRVEGKVQNAIDCLRSALYYSPDGKKTMAWIGLANIFLKTGHLSDAAYVAELALTETDFLINYYTLATIKAHQDNFEEALRLYDICLDLQPNFEPVLTQWKTVYCSINV